MRTLVMFSYRRHAWHLVCSHLHMVTISSYINVCVYLLIFILIYISVWRWDDDGTLWDNKSLDWWTNCQACGCNTGKISPATHHTITIAYYQTNTMRKFSSPFDKKDHLMCVTLDGFDTTLAAVGNNNTTQ